MINRVHSTDRHGRGIELRLPDLTGESKSELDRSVLVSVSHNFLHEDTSCEAYEVSDRRKRDPRLGLHPASFLEETLQYVPYEPGCITDLSSRRLGGGGD
jgi:hypothetical protein